MVVVVVDIGDSVLEGLAIYTKLWAGGLPPLPGPPRPPHGVRGGGGSPTPGWQGGAGGRSPPANDLVYMTGLSDGDEVMGASGSMKLRRLPHPVDADFCTWATSTQCSNWSTSSRWW